MDKGLAPVEQGRVAGREYASRAGGDHAKLRPIVRSRNAEETRAAVDGDLLEQVPGAQEVAFWSGFVHGVREFLVDEAATPFEDSPGP
ncbi:MAG TPA: hypothetical protein VH063_09110 [Gaiellaceae bacterium]|jgi:hypothetical protein|nr:hypothetical protein [Gaiellaceae bacterium]